MRFCCLLVPATLALHGAVIRGTVVENRTGRALSRTLVSLQPVAGTPGKASSINTSTSGGFEFLSLAPGAYVLKASRRGFIPMEYGQKRWNSAGLPVILAEDSSPFLTIRLPRYGAVTGTIVDENDVGVPQPEVLVYRATQPPQLAGRSTGDERGVYRISGLEPGSYLVRTTAKQEEGAEYLPTFSRETSRVEQAHAAEVYLDEDSKDVNVRPMQGRLFTLSGSAEPFPPTAGPVTVTLVSDMGRQTGAGPGFRFDALPPGQYELFAEMPENPRLGFKAQSAYQQVSLLGNKQLSLSLQPTRETRFEFTPELPGSSNSIVISARHKDLAGVGPPHTLDLKNDRALLAVGRYELALTPPPRYYVAAFSGSSRVMEKVRPDGWNEIIVNNALSPLRWTLASGAGAVHGVVKSTGDPVVGAPVYLEAYDPNTRQRITDLRATRTGMRGEYRFEGLAPGVYRVLSTFEYQMPDSAAMDIGGARSLEVVASGDLQTDLDLFGER
jgi:hypothetical protein